MSGQDNIIKDDDTSHYNGVLLEDIDSKLAAILEGQAAMASVPGRLANLKTDMGEVKTDVKVLKTAVKNLSTTVEAMGSDITFIKGAVSEQSSDLDDHERRLKRLELVAA